MNYAVRSLIGTLLLAVLCVAGEKDSSLHWQALYEQATSFEKEGSSVNAAALYEKSLKLAEQVGDDSGAAKCFIAIAKIRIRNGNYAEAMEVIQQAKRIGEKLRDQTILFSALIAISEAQEGQSKYSESFATAQKALEIATELGEARLLSIATRTAGHSHYYQGQFNTALEYYKKSLAYAEESGDLSELSLSLKAMGVAVSATDSPYKGIPYLQNAMDMAEKAGEKSSTIGILTEIGIAYRRMGMYEEAADSYLRCLEAAEKAGLKETKARILNNLGVVYKNQGRNDEAIRAYQQALKIAEELNNQKGLALLFNNIGNLIRTEGRYEEALSYFERSLHIRKQINDQWGIASALINMGLVLQAKQEYEQAVGVFKEALSISEGIGNKPRVVLALRNLAEAYLNTKNYGLAKENFNRALALAKEVQSESSVGYAFEGLGNLYFTQANYEEAANHYHKAFLHAEEVSLPELKWRAGFGMAKSYENLGQYSRAFQYYVAAIDEIEHVRARASSDEGKSSFLAKHFPTYEGLIALLYKRHLMDKKNMHVAQAFDYSERARARMFLDTLTEFESGIRRRVKNDQMVREKEIFRKISNLQTELWETTREVDRKKKKSELRQIERELDLFILDLKHQNPSYSELKYPSPLKLSAIRKYLNSKTALLQFLVGENDSFVFTVTSNGLWMRKLPGRAQLEQSVRDYLKWIRHPPKTSLGVDARSLRREFQKDAAALFQQLISPVSEMLKGKENLVLIPDGILHYVPFETLVVNDDRLLLEDHRITYAPSATIWANLKKKPKPKNTKQVLAFADPVWTSESLNSAGERWGDLKRLPYSREEVLGIADLYPEPLTSIHLATEATEEKLKAANMSSYAVLHIATHVRIEEDVPRRSGILLSNDPSGSSDGVLQMHEIWNLQLNTELVVLSGCETGIGKLVTGEGMVSMMRAFFYAGTRSLVVSLWNVDDKSTAILMKKFYVHRKAGQDDAESLRRAKLDLIAEAKSGAGYAAYEHPYYWSAFTLMGAGD